MRQRSTRAGGTGARRWRGLAGPAILLVLSACGRPEALNPARELSAATRTLGIYPFYPFRELPRIGGIYLVDRAAPDDGAYAATDRSRVLLTEALVGEFASAFRARSTVQQPGRHRQSPETLVTALQPSSGTAHYRQPGPPPLNSAGPVAALPMAARSSAMRLAGAMPAVQEPAAEDNLPLGALPSFNLGSIDQSLFAASLPTQFASFLAGLGFRQTSYVRMEAEGVEYADLPFDQVVNAIRRACNRQDSLLREGGSSQEARQLIQIGTYKLETDLRQRRGFERAQPVPVLGVLTRVYYLRGIRFIVNETRAMNAIAQAALANRLPAGITAPAVPAITINNAAPAAPQGAPAATPPPTAAMAAQIDALNQSVQALRTAVAGGAGGALSVARATSRGLEQVEVFDRPLAFGFDALWTGPVRIERTGDLITQTSGLSGLCAIAPRVEGP